MKTTLTTINRYIAVLIVITIAFSNCVVNPYVFYNTVVTANDDTPIGDGDGDDDDTDGDDTDDDDTDDDDTDDDGTDDDGTDGDDTDDDDTDGDDTDGDDDTDDDTDDDDDDDDDDDETTDDDDDTTDGDDETTDEDDETSDGDDDTLDDDTDNDEDEFNCICVDMCTEDDINLDCPACVAGEGCCLDASGDVGSMLPDFEEGSAVAGVSSPVSVNVTYGGTAYAYETSYDSNIGITNTDYIAIEVLLNSTHSGGKIEFDIPVGFELANAPGINSLNSSGAIVSKDFLGTETSFTFSDTSIGWSKDSNISGYVAKSGTLSYNLRSTALSLTIYIKADGNFISYENASEVYEALKVTYNSNDYYTPKFEVKSNTYRLSASNLTALQEIDDFIGALVDSTDQLVYGIQDTVQVSSTFTVANNFIGSKSITGSTITIYLDVPNDAIVTKIGASVGTGVPNADGVTTRYPLTLTGRSLAYSLTVSNYVSIQFPSDKFPVGNYAVKIADYSITVSDFNASSKSFTTKTILASEFGNFSGISTTVKIIKENDLTENEFAYSPTLRDYTSNIQKINTYSDTEYLTATELLNLKLRTIAEENYFSFSSKPMTLTYVQTPGYNNDSVQGTVLLDNVSKVILATPLLGNVDLYSTKVYSMQVWYEDDETEYLFDTEDQFKAINWHGTTETGFYPIIADDGEIDGEVFSSTSIVASFADVGAVYTCRNQYSGNSTYSNITFTAPTGKSIQKIEVKFAGDNNTHTDGYSYIYGIPKNPIALSSAVADNDLNAGLSLHTLYCEHSITGSSGTKVSSYSRGFRWLLASEFEMSISNLTRSMYPSVYTYNTAQNNLRLQIANWVNNPRGYLDLAVMGYSNDTGSASSSDVVFRIVPNDNHKDGPLDVVKEIVFPYNSSDALGLNQISRIEYKYNEDSVEYVYDRDFHGISNKPFTIGSRSVYGESAYYSNPLAYMTAPSDKSFEYLNITYESWDKSSDTRYVMMKGYIQNHDTTARTTINIHSVYISYYYDGVFQQCHGNATGKSFSATGSPGVNFEILNTTTSTIDSSLAEVNLLKSGRTSTLQYYVYSGTGLYDTNSYRDIEFYIVLPPTMELRNATATNFSTMYSSSYYEPYVSVETLGDMTITKHPTATVSAKDYFGNTDYDDKLANVYKIELSDDFARLYGFYSFKSPYGLNQMRFTLDLDIFVGTSASGTVLPYNKVFFMGSGTNNVSLTNNGYPGDGGAAIRFTNTTTTGYESANTISGANTLVTGKSTMYIQVDSDPFVSVHSASVVMDGNNYIYQDGNDSTIALFDELEQKGQIKFSMTSSISNDNIAETKNRVAYVYMPLPTNSDNKSDLVYQQDFDIDISKITVTQGSEFGNADVASIASSTSPTIVNNNSKVDIKFRDLPAATDVINIYEAERDFNEASASYSSTSNTLILKLSGLDIGETYDVTIDFTCPSDPEVSGFIDIAPVVVYNYSDMNLNVASVFFGGRTPSSSYMTVSPDLVANNPIRFEFDHPEWDISYESMLYYVFNNVEVVIPIYKTSYTTDKDVEHNSTFSPPTGEAVAGYDFQGWYYDSTLKDAVSSSFVVTQDTTLYAMYTPKQYEVIFDNFASSSTGLDSYTVSWDRADFPSIATSLLGIETDKAGSNFLGWSTTTDGSNGYATSTTRYSDLAVNDSQETLTLYAVYDTYVYTVSYDYLYYGVGLEAKKVNWNDAGLIYADDVILANHPGQELLGWYVLNELDGDAFAVTSTMTYADVIDKLNTMYSPTYTYNDLTSSIRIRPEFNDIYYTVKYNDNGNVFDNVADVNMNDLSIAYVDSGMIPADEPYIAGKTFLGWGTQPDVTDSDFMYVTSTTPYATVSTFLGYSANDPATNSVTLYAHFEDIKYTVIYDLGATRYYGAPASIEVEFGWDGTGILDFTDFMDTDDFAKSSYFSSADDETYFKDMYKFVGWYSDTPLISTNQIDISTESGKKYSEWANDETQYTVTLYARYDIIEYAIHYLIAEDTSLSADEVQYLYDNASFFERGDQDASTYILPFDPSATTDYIHQKGSSYDYTDATFSVDGYEWKGWTLGDDLNNENDDDPEDDFKTIGNLLASTPYYEAYGYDNDSDSDDYWELAVQGDDPEMPDALTVYGNFEAIKYTLTFVSGDSDTDDQIQTINWRGEGILDGINDPDPAEGYQFIGWYYTKADGTTVKIEDTLILADFVDIASDVDIEINAVYEEKIYYLYYILEGESGDPGDGYNENYFFEYKLNDLIKYDDAVAFNNDAYTFIGWFTSREYKVQIDFTNNNYTYKELFEILRGENYTNPDYDDVYDEGISIFAKFVADINVEVTKDTIVFDASNTPDNSSVIIDTEQQVINRSVETVKVSQEVIEKHENWNFVTSLNTSKFDLLTEVYSTESIVQEVANINDISYDEAVETLTELGLYDPTLITLTEMNEMYVTINDEVLMYNDVDGDTNPQEYEIIPYENLTIKTNLRYLVKEIIEQETTIDLFTVEYTFKLKEPDPTV